MVLVFLISIALFGGDAAAQPGARWIVVGSTAPDDIEQRLTEVLRNRVGRVLTSEAAEFVDPAAFAKELSNLSASRTVFAITDPNTLGEISARGGWQELASRGFELVSPRIWGRTLYVFAVCPGSEPGPCGELNRNAPLRGWVHWAGSQDPEVRGRASAILRRLGYANVDFTFVDRPESLAFGLRGSANGGVDIVCIFEEEPSDVLNQFLVKVTTRARLVAIDLTSDATSIEVTSGVPSVAMPYDSQRFYQFSNSKIDLPAAAAVTRVPAVIVTPPPAVPDPRAFTLPLLLTNARRTGDLAKIEGALRTSLSQVTSVAYVRTLFEQGQSRCDSRDRVASEQFKTVLLNSFFTDRNNPYAVLGLLGHLVYSQNTDPAAVEIFKRIMREEYKVPGTSTAGISQWLRDQTKINKVDLRARFADYPPERIYSETVASISAALREPTSTARRNLLERSRDTLVSLADVALSQTCGKREAQRGLWTGMDFEPFFYLVVINAALSEMGSPQ